MTKKQREQAAKQWKQREKATNAERIVVPGYPYSHNPYIVHGPVEDCLAGCIHAQEAR